MAAARSGQRNGALAHSRRVSRSDFAQSPLAHAIAAGALRKIDVNVILVKAVRTRSKHRREAGAGCGAHGETEFLRGGDVARVKHMAIVEAQRADIERVGL